MQNKRPIWHAAERLVRTHGIAAPSLAATRAHRLLEAGQIERRKDWMRIQAACRSLVKGPDRVR